MTVIIKPSRANAIDFLISVVQRLIKKDHKDNYKAAIDALGPKPVSTSVDNYIKKKIARKEASRIKKIKEIFGINEVKISIYESIHLALEEGQITYHIMHHPYIYVLSNSDLVKIREMYKKINNYNAAYDKITQKYSHDIYQAGRSWDWEDLERLLPDEASELIDKFRVILVEAAKAQDMEAAKAKDMEAD